MPDLAEQIQKMGEEKNIGSLKIPNRQYVYKYFRLKPNEQLEKLYD